MGARDLLDDLAGLGVHVAADGDQLVIRPASKLTDDMRAALRANKPELLALLAGTGHASPVPDVSAVAWSGADIARFLDRRARLLRWGWSEVDAEVLAERLVRRDRECDERVSCTDCRHYRPGRCGNHRRAALQSPEIGRDLAGMLQRCPGFQRER